MIVSVVILFNDFDLDGFIYKPVLDDEVGNVSGCTAVDNGPPERSDEVGGLTERLGLPLEIIGKRSIERIHHQPSFFRSSTKTGLLLVQACSGLIIIVAFVLLARLPLHHRKGCLVR